MQKVDLIAPQGKPILPHEISCVPRVRNAALNTLELCPSNVLKHEPSEMAHIFMVLSPDDVITH